MWLGGRVDIIKKSQESAYKEPEILERETDIKADIEAKAPFDAVGLSVGGKNRKGERLERANNSDRKTRTNYFDVKGGGTQPERCDE